MKILVLAFKTSSERNVTQRQEVLEMDDNYDLKEDAEHGRFDKLRKAFSDHVLNGNCYDAERERWRNPFSFEIGAVSRL